MEKKSEIKKDHNELITCLEIGKYLTSTTDFHEILELIVSKGSELIKADHWSLLLKDEKTDKLVFVIVTGADMKDFQSVCLGPGEGIASHVAETGIPMFVPDVSAEPLFNREVDRLTGFTTRSVACIPLANKGRVSGVIEIVNIEDMTFFGRNNYPILSILADYAAIAIQNARYVSKIKTLTITDEYTGLFNSRYLHSFLDDFFTQADEKSKIAAVFVDIDNFKDIVDFYGHLDGSDILRQIGVTISQSLTDKDILIKYGGDEYVILFPDTSTDEAVKRTGIISEKLNASRYVAGTSQTTQVTASFGVASYPENAENKKDLLIAADNALFKIKNGTKNSIGKA